MYIGNYKYLCLRLVGSFCAIVLLLISIGYVIASVFAAFDQHGREVYFDNSTEEFTFLEAKELKELHPDWIMHTDDWGYFYRAHIRRNEAYWEEFDVLFCIILTSCITGMLWILVSIMDIYKYSTLAWKVSIPVIIISTGTLVGNFLGNVFILYKISSLACNIDRFVY